jgi:hypothetical protein
MVDTMTRISLQDKAEALARKKQELGIDGFNYVPVNSGRNRSESKRELLRKIDREVRARGATPRFQAIIG